MHEDLRPYIKQLCEQAQEIALRLNDQGKLLIDPQGRVLVEVTLGDQVGFPQRTTVSLDILSQDKLRKVYMEQYGLKEKQMEQLASIRDSIIPLQQEYYFHLSLAKRIYSKLDPAKFPEEKMDRAYQKTMEQVHALITEAFKAALKKATKTDNTIDNSLLIKELDKARKGIFDEAHLILMKEIVRETGVVLSAAELKKMDFKGTAAKTTATSNELAHVNALLGQVTLIGGTDISAHDRGLGTDKIAAREIMTFSFDPKNKEPSGWNLEGPLRQQIRIPSLDVKDQTPEKKAVSDIAKKLKFLRDELDIESPFIYNLYTAINDRATDFRNKQSQGARYILMGAHEYNRGQIDRQYSNPDRERKQKPFCFVQNISVNGFGEPLGYYGGNNLRNEATLMAEMAMIYNLSEPLESGESGLKDEKANSIIELYKDYLKRESREPFFSQSKEGKKAALFIQQIKNEWKSASTKESSPSSLVEKAKAALKTMMANNLHFKHEYSKLIQSLSVFVEPVSIGGCKSGNERTQAINGRVAILDSVASGTTDLSISSAISALAKAGPKEVVAKARILKQKLDAKYNEHLQSGASLISLADQGAAPKIRVKKGIYGVLNRNYGEEPLSLLYQDNASNMQAHKGLVKSIIKAWKGPKVTFADYIKLAPGILGVIRSILAFPVAYSQYKKAKEKTFQRELGELSASNSKAFSPQETADVAFSSQTHTPKSAKISKVFSSQETADESLSSKIPIRPWSLPSSRRVAMEPLKVNRSVDRKHQAELKGKLTNIEVKREPKVSDLDVGTLDENPTLNP